MKIRNKMLRGRKIWELDNDSVTLQIMQGGGHISGLLLNGGPAVNPLWNPVWKTIDPWKPQAANAARYGSKLLAAISGHNPCLSAFGDPSPEEAKAGLGCHGEAPIVRWKAMGRRMSSNRLTFVCGCDLPIAQMRFVRQFSMKRGSNLISVKSRLTNLSRRDVPFTMCEHVTFGPPFLEKGVTQFDMSATRGHTSPGEFCELQRLKMDKAFQWPKGPGRKGTIDLRTIGKMPRVSSDFTTQLMDPSKQHAWFSALNPRQGLLVAYVWRRSDFPWLGNWEENHARKAAPWNGKSLTRGMEFTNTPFPVGLRKAVDMGSFHGLPTYRWLPARETLEMEFNIVAMRVGRSCRGVAAVTPTGRELAIEFLA